MKPNLWHEVQRVVELALAVPVISRGDVLDRECGEDDALRCEVESLLSASSSAGDFLESPAVVLDRRDVSADGERETDQPSAIGNYRILRRLGSGGMGVVYLAEQNSPRRQVALKVIRAGVAGSRSRLRFAREAEVLGRLKHPGIAQIYQAGHALTHGEDHAFIAMEYVEGESLGDYVRRAAPSIAERLALLAQICDAVQHAHQKGVIHRDLKPANILIQSAPATSGGVPTARVLDFGIARIVDDDNSAAITLSSPLQIIGTLLYMSPEQISGHSKDIDTRSDVYSLGVVGYEMVCDALPYELDSRAAPEIMRAICDAAPRAMSRVDRRYAGDLETIFQKALEKEPHRRYASAAAFADDLRCYLNQDLISARKPSAAYQWRMFARRHRGMVIGACAAVLGLVGGTSVAVWNAIEAGRERDRAVKAERLADNRLIVAQDAQDSAEQEAATSAAVVAFLRDTLTAASPEAVDPADATIRDALDRAAAKIGNDLANQPAVEAEIRLAIGETYRSLGAQQEAANHLDKAVELAALLYGRDSLKCSNALLAMGVLERDRGHNELSELLLRECLATRTALLESPHLEIAAVESALAATLVRLGRHAQAVELHEQALAVRRSVAVDDGMSVAESLSALAIAQRFLGRYETAATNYGEALRIRRTVLRPGHPHIAVTLHNLSRVMHEVGKYDDAITTVEEALAITRMAYDGAHPITAGFLSSYAETLAACGRIEEADTALQEALTMQRGLFPDGHLDLVKTLLSLASLPHHRADATYCKPLLEEADRLAAEYGSADDRFAVTSLQATHLMQQDHADQAEALMRQRLAELRERYGDDHAKVANARMSLAESLMIQGKLDQSRHEVAQALAIRQRMLGEAHPLVTLCIHDLAFIERRAGNLDQARTLFEQAVARHRATLGMAHHETVDMTFELAWLLCDMDLTDEAEPLLRECLAHYRNGVGGQPAVRVAECAVFLQVVASHSPRPDDYRAVVDAAVAHAAAELGPDHEYLTRLAARIDEIRQGGGQDE